MSFTRFPLGMLRSLPRWVAVCVWGTGAALAAQPSITPDSLQVLESSGAWSQLAAAYSSLVKAGNTVDSFTYLCGRAHYHAGDLPRALTLLTQYTANDETARYASEANFLAGNCQYRMGSFESALFAYTRAYGFAPNGEIKRAARSAILTMFRSASAIYPSVNWFDVLDLDARCQLLDTLAELRVQRGDPAGADQLRQLCAPSRDENNRPAGDDASLKIALLLPLRGDYANYADELMSGITLALETVRKTSKQNITIVPYDTEGDPLIAGRLARTILTERDIDAIIGPLTSSEAAVVAATVASAPLPVIIPAAADAGFAELSKSVWQFTPSIEFQAREAARYARETEQADSAIVIALDAPHYRRMADLFASEFARSGGTVLGVMHYSESERDFGRYFRDIKRLVRPNVYDSLRYLSSAGDTLEPDATPARIECLYLPGDVEQLRLLLPQLLFNNVTATLIGSDSWAHTDVLHLDERVTRHARIPAGVHVDSTAERDARFAEAIRDENPPHKSHLSRLGWDAVMFLHDAGTASGAASREGMLKSLRRTNEFVGATGTMRFGADGANRELPFYKINGTKLERVIEPALAGDAEGSP